MRKKFFSVYLFKKEIADGNYLNFTIRKLERQEVMNPQNTPKLNLNQPPPQETNLQNVMPSFVSYIYLT